MKSSTKKLEEWLLEDRKRYKKGNERMKGVARTKDQRIRDRASNYLTYLACLAEHLSEDQHRQVFTTESVLPIFEGFLRFASKYRPSYTREDSTSGIPDLKRAHQSLVIDERLFQLSFAVVRKCLTLSNMLIGDEYRKLLLSDIKMHGLTDRELTALSTIDRMLGAEEERRKAEKRKKKPSAHRA